MSFGEEDVCTGGSGDVALTSPSGFLSSVVAMDHGYGLARCPWTIHVSSGQTINLVLSVFGTYRRTETNKEQEEGNAPGEEICPWQIVIEENDRFTQCELCEFQALDRNLYKSSSHIMKIYFVPDRNREELPAFIVKYEGKLNTQIWSMLNGKY